MSGSNSDTLAAGETLFDFLKRKKKCNLEHTLTKSIASYRSTVSDHRVDKTQITPPKRSQQKVVSFAHDRIDKSMTKSIPFVQMLSPAPNRKGHNRQHIRKVLSGLRECVMRVMQMGERAKSKANALAVQIYTVCSACQHDLLPNIKQGIKVVQNIFGSLSQTDVQQQVLNLERIITEYIDHMEHRDKTEVAPNIALPPNQLISINRKLEKQVITLRKRLEKMEEQYEQEKQLYDREQQKEEKVGEQLRVRHAEQKEEYMAKIGELEKSNEELKLKTSQLEKYIKNETYLHEEKDRKQRDIALEADKSRQEYFKNEMDTMRRQYTNDINRIEVLSRVKEQELELREKELKEKLSGKEFEWEVERERRERAEKEVRLMQEQCNIVREKDKELLRDMEHMNYEFYHHWLALKDIKTLTKRLNAFAPVQRIYTDLAFNDSLFP